MSFGTRNILIGGGSGDGSGVVPKTPLTQFLESWTAAAGAVPVAEVVTTEGVATRIEDNTGGISRYTLQDNLPLTEPRMVRLKLRRQPGATHVPRLRLAFTGFAADLQINIGAGTTFVTTVGAATAPVVNRVSLTDTTMEIIVTFQPNAGFTQWDLFPSIANQNGNQTGALDILELDMNYTEPVSLTTTSQGSGLFMVGERHEPTAPIALPAPNVVTGHNFTQINADHPNAKLVIKIVDGPTNRNWANSEIDIATMLENVSDGVNTDSFIHIFDNDFVTVTVVDAATGELSLGESGREVAYCYSEVIAPVPQTATSNYQDIGNTRIQWGVEAADGVVTLPVPFADTSYVVTTANTFPSGQRSSQVIENTKTTTQFEIRAFASNAASATGSNWMAIGIKP